MDEDSGTIRAGSDGYVPIVNNTTNTRLVSVERERENAIRFLSILLHGLLFTNFVILVGIGTYFFFAKCNECETKNRILAMAILLKAFIHSGLNVLKLKKHEQIKNSERLRKIVRYVTRFFRLLSFALTTISFYHLHSNKYNCTPQTFAVKIIRYYYFAMITIYFFPIFLYLFFGFFIYILVYIMVNVSVHRSDRIPTPRNIMNKLEKKKFKDLDINKNKNPKEMQADEMRNITSPSINFFYEQMKKAIEEKNKYKNRNNSNNNNNNTPNSTIPDVINTTIDSNNNNNNNKNSTTNIGNTIKSDNSTNHNGDNSNSNNDLKPNDTNENVTGASNELNNGNVTCNDVDTTISRTTTTTTTNNNNNHDKNESMTNMGDTHMKYTIDGGLDNLRETDDKEESGIFHDNIDNLLDEEKEQLNSEETDYACTICLLNYTGNCEVLIMPCDKRHFFHATCVSKWLSKSQVCPICRQNIVNYFNNEDVV